MSDDAFYRIEAADYWRRRRAASSSSPPEPPVLADVHTYRALLTMISEDQWAGFPDSVVKNLADGAEWRFSFEAKERKEGAYWYPTANPDAARRTGHYVNKVAHAYFAPVDGTAYACTLRHESDDMLYALLALVKRRARKELEMRARDE